MWVRFFWKNFLYRCLQVNDCHRLKWCLLFKFLLDFQFLWKFPDLIPCPASRNLNCHIGSWSIIHSLKFRNSHSCQSHSLCRHTFKCLQIEFQRTHNRLIFRFQSVQLHWCLCNLLSLRPCDFQPQHTLNKV